MAAAWQPDDAGPPWRVEGVPDKEKDQRDGRRGWSRFWWILLTLLILNWLLGALLMGAARPTVPYTFFLGQLNVGNVQQVSSTGNTIQGTFRHQVSYPAGTKNTEQVQQFATERPTYANDHLFQQLQAHGVT